MTRIASMTMKPSKSPHCLRWIALFALGLALLQTGCQPDETATAGEENASIEEMLARAEAGEATAQNIVATEFLRGEMLEQNTAKALNYFYAAAEQGNSKALYNLGVLHQAGQHVEQNIEAAFNYFTKASRRGLPEAQMSLGVLYEQGMGTEQNIEEAAYWYRRAATFGKPADSSKPYYQGQLLPHRQEQFLHGNKDAQFLLGQLREQGAPGVDQDLRSAIRWYEDAAIRGDAASQHRLAVLYAIENKPEKDLINGYAWAKLAIDYSLEQNDGYIQTFNSIATELTGAQQSTAETRVADLKSRIQKNQSDPTT